MRISSSKPASPPPPISPRHWKERSSRMLHQHGTSRSPLSRMREREGPIAAVDGRVRARATERPSPVPALRAGPPPPAVPERGKLLPFLLALPLLLFASPAFAQSMTFDLG